VSLPRLDVCVVRLAGVEPATLGLEVLRAADPLRLTFHLLRSETARSPECVKVRGIARRCVSLVTVSVTAEQLPLSDDAAESEASAVAYRSGGAHRLARLPATIKPARP